MTTPDIPDDAVEAAARAAHARILFDNMEEFDKADPTVQELWRSIARAALLAALPALIAAEREACARVADDVASPPGVISAPDGRHDDWCHGWQDGAQEAAAAIRARDLSADLPVRQMPGERG